MVKKKLDYGASAQNRGQRPAEEARGRVSVFPSGQKRSMRSLGLF